MEIKDWAEQLRITPGYEDMGAAVLKLIDDKAMDDEVWSGVEASFEGYELELNGDDPVASVEAVVERYAHVRKVFCDREEFDLSGPSYERDLGQVLMVGDRAGTFKWKVLGILRKAGAIPDGKVTMGDDQLLMLLGMMMP